GEEPRYGAAQSEGILRGGPDRGTGVLHIRHRTRWAERRMALEGPVIGGGREPARGGQRRRRIASGRHLLAAIHRHVSQRPYTVRAAGQTLALSPGGFQLPRGTNRGPSIRGHYAEKTLHPYDPHARYGPDGSLVHGAEFGADRRRPDYASVKHPVD